MNAGHWQLAVTGSEVHDQLLPVTPYLGAAVKLFTFLQIYLSNLLLCLVSAYLRTFRQVDVQIRRLRDLGDKLTEYHHFLNGIPLADLP